MNTSIQKPEERAVARGILWKLAAELFHYPSKDAMHTLSDDSLWNAALVAAGNLNYDETRRKAAEARVEFKLNDARSIEHHYINTFGHSVRAAAPLYDTEWGIQEGLLAPHMIADVAAFYRAHGVETGPGGERADHLAVECEFLHFLAFKEAHALTTDRPPLAETCADATKKFLAEHVARFAPAFARKLPSAGNAGPYVAFGEFLRAFVLAECQSLGVRSGEEELPQRALSFEDENPCISCSLNKEPDTHP
ncbi:MAG: molecular chaperone TorD family protein [Planctomycetes bacterium]|nr:molecular chaperone TorD family protein [Planctomycetota bacterium]